MYGLLQLYVAGYVKKMFFDVNMEDSKKSFERHECTIATTSYIWARLALEVQ